MMPALRKFTLVWSIETFILLAAAVIAEGLVDLGILQGNAEDLVEMDAHALFFPSRRRASVGIDHDMEDLGTEYEEGRFRSDRFGLNFLRLNRPHRLECLLLSNLDSIKSWQF